MNAAPQRGPRQARLESGRRHVLAQHGEDALARYRELRPDLTTLDIVMPRMDGVSALRHRGG